MFYHDKKLQFPVRVEKPNPLFAKMLQQAIGGTEGEIRVCLQYLFQAWGSRAPTTKYRDMLLETGTEEIAHIEMLATAVALNLETAPASMKEAMAAANPMVGAVLGGMDPRHVLSSGLAAMATDSNGVPFNGSWVVGCGNIAADMYVNVMAESTGRVLATRLWEMTDDPGMKDMLSFLIARDTMHQNQWLAVIEELGGPLAHPIPNTFPQSEEAARFSYAFISTLRNGEQTPSGRWTEGDSINGKGRFEVQKAEPEGEVPVLGPARPDTYGQKEQLSMTQSVINKVREVVTL